MRCDDLARSLSAATDGERLQGRAADHVGSCLRCQAELVQYRKLVRVLRTLRTEVLAPGPSLAADILAGLEQAGERSAVRSLLADRPRSRLGALAASATGAAVAVTIVVAGERLLARRRPARLDGGPDHGAGYRGGQRRGQ